MRKGQIQLIVVPPKKEERVLLVDCKGQPLIVEREVPRQFGFRPK